MQETELEQLLELFFQSARFGAVSSTPLSSRTHPLSFSKDTILHDARGPFLEEDIFVRAAFYGPFLLTYALGAGFNFWDTFTQNPEELPAQLQGGSHIEEIAIYLHEQPETHQDIFLSYPVSVPAQLVAVSRELNIAFSHQKKMHISFPQESGPREVALPLTITSIPGIQIGAGVMRFLDHPIYDPGTLALEGYLDHPLSEFPPTPTLIMEKLSDFLQRYAGE